MIHAAAIRYKTTVYTLAQPAGHPEIIGWIEREHGEFSRKDAAFGFMTDTGEYVDRKIAGEIALRCGQIMELSCAPDLYTEDLW